MSLETCQDFFTQNTDISGIGVRVAFYLQLTFTVIQVTLSPKEYRAAFWTLLTTTLSLMIAALSSTVRGELSFYNAHLVESLVWFANGGLALVMIELATPYADMGGAFSYADLALFIIFVSVEIIIFVLTGGLWGSGLRFGPQAAECIPLIKFYISFGRIKGSFNRIKASFVVNLLVPAIVALIWASVVVFRRSTSSKQSPVQRERDYWLPALVTGCLFSVWMILYLPAIELYLKQSAPSDEGGSPWSFGQILALMTIVPSAAAVIESVYKLLRPPNLKGSSEPV